MPRFIIMGYNESHSLTKMHQNVDSVDEYMD